MNLTRFVSHIRMQTPANPTNGARLVFLTRLGSTLALWSIALYIIFSGFEIGFFLLIGGIGMIGLWEFYNMLDHKGLPNFKYIGMICGAVFHLRQLLLLQSGQPRAVVRIRGAVLLFFMLVVFARQMFQKTRHISPLETMAYTLFGLLYVVWLFNFLTKIVYVVPHRRRVVTGHFYVLYLIVVTKFSDMGAYLTGSVFGKHPLIPSYQPQKNLGGIFRGARLLAPGQLRDAGAHAS